MTSYPTPEPRMEQPAKTMRERFPPRARTPGGALWALLGLLQKKRIEWEDRLGLFGYADWIRSVERAQHREIRRQARMVEAAESSFSFVVCGGEISLGVLEQTLQSLQQVKAKWWLVVPALKNSAVFTAPWLPALTAREPRLRVVAAEPSMIDSSLEPDSPAQAADWPRMLAQMPGDWVVPLRCGDTLSPSWFDAFAVSSTHHPQSDLFYWDEDEQLAPGKRIRPFFKPGWSPELLFACNYLESAAFRRNLLVSMSTSRSTWPAGWLFDAAAAARGPQRIPLVLQHRAPITELDRERIASAHAFSIRAALQQRGLQQVEVNLTPGGSHTCGCHHVRWKTSPALVSIIIPTRNNPGYLKRCLTTLIQKTTGVDYEIILMDDHSDDTEVVAFYQEIQNTLSNVRVVPNDGPFNYSRVNNQGAKIASGDLLLFLNNDVEILEGGWLEEMVRWAQLPKVGMVGAKLLYPDGKIQHGGIVLGMTGHAGHLFAGRVPDTAGLFLSPDCSRDVSAVTGACMMVRRDVFEQLGGFDENLMLVFNDVELGLRFVRNGWRVVYAPAAALIHHEGMSRSRYMPPGDIRLAAEQLSTEIEHGDYWYNPNLSLAVNWPTFRRPYEQDAISRLEIIARYKG